MTRIIVGNMLHAVRTVSVQRGRDPRGLTMFAYGGASGLFAAEICRGIGISRVDRPELRRGVLRGRPARGRSDPHGGRTVQWPPEAASSTSSTGRSRRCAGRGGNLDGRGFGSDEIEVEYVLAMRFAGQTFDVDVPMEARPLTDDDRAPLVDERSRSATASSTGPGSVWENFPMDVMTARVVARGVRDKPPPAAPERRPPATRRRAERPGASTRRVYLTDAGAGRTLRSTRPACSGWTSASSGPCIVEDVDTTIFVPRDASAFREAYRRL